MSGRAGHRSRKRLGVARFWYEGNAFAPLPADLASFERREWRSGAEALDAARGTQSELAAVAEFIDRHADWDVVVLRCASALPAGPIDDVVFDRILREIGQGIAAREWNAIYLSLHGAAITAARQAPDLDLIRRVREIAPEVPIGASFDLHGNIAPEIASLIDVMSVYRTHPHVDMAETAARVLDGLRRCAESGVRTRRVVRHANVVLPSFNMRTSGGPMCELERLAREASTGSILEVGVFGGFPYADTVHTGASVFVVSDAAHDPQGAEAQQVAARMTEEIARRAPAFEVTLPGPAEAIRLALATPGDDLVAVTDPADNPLSGGGCDTPALFRALLDARVQAPALFASFADPAIVAAAKRAGIGTSMDIKLGARFGEHFGCGVEVRATVERLTDGEFRNAGPMEHGVVRRCGSTALLRIEGSRSLRVIVTADVVPADDPAFYALHGIDPSTLRLLCVKAKNHFRAAFAGRCRAIIDCDAPGPACVDLSRLPFRNVPAARFARR